MRILLFGGSGRLGSRVVERLLKNGLVQVFAPIRSECDICCIKEVEAVFVKFRPDVVINCAALVGTKECEENKKLAWQVNVVGNSNIVKTCQKHGARMVFISTNTVFDGKKGRYKETDTPNPTFFYAVTKVVSEQVTGLLANYVVIRLDFYSPGKLKYSKVFCDHYTSKISVRLAAEMVVRVAKSSFVGILHIGQSRRSLYDILKPGHPEIVPIKIVDSALANFPKDLSFNLSKYNKLFSE